MFDRDAGKTVQQPRSLEETSGTWTGLLVDMWQRSGKNDKRAWVLHTIEGEGKVAFTTFSNTDALLARCAMESELPVVITWERDLYDGKALLTIGTPVEGRNELELQVALKEAYKDDGK